VVGLLPARNAAHDLPGYFRSVAPVVDAVVALDDGSTDETGELLEAEPAVEVLLRNPRRPSYQGWDDSANRNRLLAAAADLEPAWLLFLDADERLDPDDAAALRAFLDDGADEGYAYGMRVFRMIEGLQYWDRGGLWVYRLFAHDGGALPGKRLHFVPVPATIPMERWLKTTIRIQHLANLTPRHRRARFEKYLEADPDNRFQPSYANLLDPPGELKLWERRPPDLAVVANGSSNGGWPS
jgi:glycosyltransferase involved in cell wall biosynthesis